MARKYYIKDDVLSSKLHTAFVSLRQHGIISKHKFLCCMSCGYAAMPELIEAIEAKGKRVRGVAFYHDQDYESIARNNSVALCYDGHNDIDQALIGREVVKALIEAGYSEADIDWNGSPGMRIIINNVL